MEIANTVDVGIRIMSIKSIMSAIGMMQSDGTPVIPACTRCNCEEFQAYRHVSQEYKSNGHIRTDE